MIRPKNFPRLILHIPIIIFLVSLFQNCKDADPDRIALPVCACIVRGASWTIDPNNTKDWIHTGNSKLTNDVNQLIYQTNDKVWIPGADIAMVPQIAKDDGFIKVIDDPDLSVGKQGDIEATQAGGALIAGKCREAWGNSLIQDGLVIIIAHNLIYNDGQVTMFSGYSDPPDLVLARNQGKDLCSFPRNLTKDDLRGKYILIEDPKLLGLNGEAGNGLPYVVLGHEFGHVLMLGHGDGLDNDGNGALPPTNGPRLFDAYCDINEYNTKDLQANTVSLMDRTVGGVTTITPLQRECARTVAALLPGSNRP